FFFLLISSCRTLPGCPALPQPRYLARGCGRPASSRHPHGSPRAPPPGSHRARPRPRPHAWGAPAEPARPYRGELGARHLYICDFHKNLIQSVRNRRKRKGSDDDGDSPVQDIDTPEVDLYQLQVNTLRRYKRHFKLQTRPGLNKAQLVEDSSEQGCLPGGSGPGCCKETGKARPALRALPLLLFIVAISHAARRELGSVKSDHVGQKLLC
uniref:Sin3A associated protein 30 n=1 Tax=Anas platyrhynchos platyrhynchos TaxID=8840 RepID=A0A493U449_ANAPP